MGLGHKSDAVSAMFQRLTGDWGHEPIEKHPRWRSQVGDDGTPYEFSVAFGRKPELRFMVEPMGRQPSLAANRAASFALLRSLARDYPLNLDRLATIEDLFLPEISDGAFAMWIAVSFTAGGGPEFKIYLTPEAHGVTRAPSIVHEAMDRLGYGRAWSTIDGVLARRGPGLDELKYFSLDLSPASTARVKVYARHQRCTRDDLEATARLSPFYVPGEITDFLEILAPGQRLFAQRAPFTCYAFVDDPGGPASATTHFPINGYADNDKTVQQRVVACFEQLKMPSDMYARSIAAYANRPLEAAIGMHAYVSVRRDATGARLTAYLPVEAYTPVPAIEHPSQIPQRLNEVNP